MASLDILCFNHFDLKNKIMKREHKKLFRGPSKILKNVSWPINICLKYFMTPTKTLWPPLPPTYLMYGPLIEYIDNYSKKSERLWQYCRDEPDFNDVGALNNFPGNSVLFIFKQKLKGSAENNDTKNVKIMVPLK